MDVAHLRMFLFLAFSQTLLVSTGAEAGASIPALHMVRDGSLGAPLPDQVREPGRDEGSAVRFFLRDSPLKSVRMRIEATEACDSPLGADDDAQTLEPGVYQLHIAAEGFEAKEACFIALSDAASTLQVGIDADEQLTVTQIVESEQARFVKGRRGLKKDSYPILGRIVQILKDNPRIKRLEVAVHTDAGGKHWSNMKLTQERADEIVGYMRRQGVDPERLEAHGYGSLQPLVKGMSREARLKNRRVEFLIRDVNPGKPMLSNR